MTSRQRWRIVWAWMRKRLTFGHPDDDVEQARRQRIEAEYDLAFARNQRARIERAYTDLRRQQQEVDFTSLVEETFSPRRYDR